MPRVLLPTLLLLLSGCTVFGSGSVEPFDAAHRVFLGRAEREQPQVTVSYLRQTNGEVDGEPGSFDLDHYRAIVADNSVLFYGLEEVLNTLEKRNIPWGIVTNKPKWLTTPLLEQMALQKRAAVVICGDTLDQRKPHALPLIVAAETMGIACEDCIYIGDDPRDITAGRAAKMKTLIAAYGYIKADARLDEWQAGGIIEHPLDLLSHPFIN